MTTSTSTTGYYGSEWGVAGQKAPGSDAQLRPPLTPAHLERAGQHPELYRVVHRLIKLRNEQPALRYGDFQECLVASEQFVFTRTWKSETVLVAVNASNEAVTVDVSGQGGNWADVLNPGETFSGEGGLELPLPPNWGRVLRRV